MMLFTFITASAALFLSPGLCESPLDGVWVFSWENIREDGAFHSITGLISERAVSGSDTTDLSIYVSEGYTQGEAPNFTHTASQTCVQALMDGEIAITCQVDSSTGAYAPDLFQIRCDQSDRVTGVLMNQAGETVAGGLELRRVMRSVR